jgi:2-hydroxychromene-2-carboxylate isomerase
MPAKTIDYYFSFVSLWSYVGCYAFDELVRKHGATVVYKPMDLMDVFASSGGLPVRQRAPQRQAYRLVEMQRWRLIRRIPLTLHPKFYPADPSRGHRMLLAALRAGQDVGAFSRAGLSAVWADELDIADAATLVKLADQSGLDGRALLKESDDPALARQEAALTAEAKQRKVFGAPFYVYRDEPFWGQDRLPLLGRALAGEVEPIAFLDATR